MRKAVLFLLVCVMFSLFSCKTASLVNFESESYEQFKNETLYLEELPEEFYYARILTATCIEIVLRRFSLNNDFGEIKLENVKLVDDKGLDIYENEQISLTSNGIVHIENDCNYEIYAFQIETSVFFPQKLENYKTDYIILSFEIDGKKYSEKLNRVEKKYIVTRT